MCGRFALTVDLKTLIAVFGISAVRGELVPRYNIAPSQQVAGIRQSDGANRELTFFRWGLVPQWAKDASIGYRMINARAETAAEKPSFRGPLRSRRCVIPATAFFEWKRTATAKVPFCIRHRDRTPLAFAGLWDRWQGADGVVETCSILTTAANSALAELHDRMPVILSDRTVAPWLDPENSDAAFLSSLLAPCPAERLEIYPVARLVNNASNDLPACLEPVAEEGGSPGPSA